VDAGGDTDTVSGVVKRNGILWAENLSLAEGTNGVNLSVINSAGFIERNQPEPCQKRHGLKKARFI
jgi:hypothetical protein